MNYGVLAMEGEYSSGAETAVEETVKPKLNGEVKTITRARLEEIRARPVETKLVHLPKPMEGEAFRIKKGKVHERESWERENTVIKNGRQRVSQDNVRAKLLIKACVNDDGSPLFAGTKADIAFINDLPADIVEYAFDEVCEYWGITKKDAEEILGGN